MKLSNQQLTDFREQGFLVLPALASSQYCQQVLQFAQQQLALAIPPLELEAQTGYPGAPATLDAEGGATVRRLMQVAARDQLIMEWATGPLLATPLKQLLGQQVLLSQAHHNCIMTKQPRFSSLTGWHRDSRSWQFRRPELISAWCRWGPRASTRPSFCVPMTRSARRCSRRSSRCRCGPATCCYFRVIYFMRRGEI